MKINTKEITFKKLTKEHIGLLLDVQEETFLAHNGDPDFLRRNTYETLEVCFDKNSLVLGAYLNDELIGFGILLDAQDTAENLAKDVEVIQDKLTSANVKLIIVRPSYRGNGLQKIIINKLQEHAKNCGFSYLCATVSPVNNYSLNNFLGTDFINYKTLNKYGGLSRILLYKKI